jgi:hypothetical protein
LGFVFFVAGRSVARRFVRSVAGRRYQGNGLSGLANYPADEARACIQSLISFSARAQIWSRSSQKAAALLFDSGTVDIR